MSEEKKLYPFKFCTLQDDYHWGSEEFKLADLGYRDSLVREGWLAGNSMSEVMDTYLDRVVGDNVYDYYGRQFPVCVRLVRCKGRMPLRVHPDDEVAAQRYDFLGKEKVWYVVRAGLDARLLVGFRRDTDAAEFYPKCLDGTAEELLNTVAPYAGQWLHIPAGTPHAALGDVEILEIAESSPMDFCLCGWGEEVHPDEFDTSLTLVDALDFINYKKYSHAAGRPAAGSAPDSERLVDLPQMRLDRIALKAPIEITREGGPFLLYTCVRGSAVLRLPLAGGKTLDYPMKNGETILVPAECLEFQLVPETSNALLLETSIVRADADPYIDPNAEPTLPED